MKANRRNGGLTVKKKAIFNRIEFHHIQELHREYLGQVFRALDDSNLNTEERKAQAFDCMRHDLVDYREAKNALRYNAGISNE